ncbi:MAG: DUF1298 domain-containing protein [Labilithrix sp.]|nr:DUF1298 domain-containing protein [Labilithrix sp.]
MTPAAPPLALDRRSGRDATPGGGATIASAGTPLEAEDAARLHMSARNNPMLITVVLALDRAIAHEVVESRLESRLARYPRFRQRVLEPRLGLGRPRWAPDPTFDVRHHVHRIDATLVPGSPSLEELTSDLASIPLAHHHPLWRAHLIDGSEPALVLIVHHALADGAALLALLGELVDDGPAERPPTPSSAPRTLRSRARHIAAGAIAASRLALARPDPQTPLRGRLGVEKELAFSSALELDALRAAARSLDTTVTGVLLAAVAGACRAQACESGHDERLVLHALVPIDVRRGASGGLGNRYGSVLVPLPIGAHDLAARVDRVRDAARALRSREAGVAGARLAEAAGSVSAFVERLGVELFSRRASVTVSSVKGPPRELRLCGAAVRDIMVWAPTAGSIGLGVTLMSYAGRARLGVVVGARAIGSARRVVEELEIELARIRAFASSTAAYTAKR